MQIKCNEHEADFIIPVSSSLSFVFCIPLDVSACLAG